MIKIIIKPVIITKKHYIEFDEVYCAWFFCPNCKDKSISINDNYCSNCGIKIKFSKTAKQLAEQ